MMSPAARNEAGADHHWPPAARHPGVALTGPVPVARFPDMTGTWRRDHLDPRRRRWRARRDDDFACRGRRGNERERCRGSDGKRDRNARDQAAEGGSGFHEKPFKEGRDVGPLPGSTVESSASVAARRIFTNSDVGKFFKVDSGDDDHTASIVFAAVVVVVVAAVISVWRRVDGAAGEKHRRGHE